MDNLPMYVYISTITILRFSMHLYVEKRNKCQLWILSRTCIYIYNYYSTLLKASVCGTTE